MRAPPEQVETRALVAALADEWSVDVEAIRYAAVGAGSYHWVVNGADGTRGFVTVDDLDQKAWLGDTRESVFDGLRRAFDTAAALRGGGLGFVVAPIPTSRGETVRRLGPRHTMALFPFVDAAPGRFGEHETAERTPVVAMLAELHRAPPVAACKARSVGLGLPGRRHIEEGLQELDQTWSGGPFSESVREVLDRHASDVAELLALADRLAADVASRGSPWVVTHGEPHTGNVMRAGERRVLVDWDTVALAPPERDLWMVVGDTGDEATIYADATGHQPDQTAIDFFRLTWDLKDLAEYIHALRSAHRHNEDTARQLEGLMECVASRDRWAALLE